MAAAPAVAARFERPGIITFALTFLAVAFLAWSFQGAGWSFVELGRGLPAVGDFLSRSWPPSVERLDRIGASILETFQMAVVGTALGVAASIPLAILASRRHTPATPIYLVARGLISFFRTVPDLVWALIFVVAVGLGPFAGTLAIMIDTIGFCGRFFAEAMEEVEEGPQEALGGLGAGRLAVVFCAVMPAALPSLVATSLFSLEKATRSSVVLGLVGAGGIGIELKVAMEMFSYGQAATIILAVFLLVLAVEQASAWLRRRIL
jgi:phosphonate transport system permease protein